MDEDEMDGNQRFLTDWELPPSPVPAPDPDDLAWAANLFADPSPPRGHLDPLDWSPLPVLQTPSPKPMHSSPRKPSPTAAPALVASPPRQVSPTDAMQASPPPHRSPNAMLPSPGQTTPPQQQQPPWMASPPGHVAVSPSPELQAGPASPLLPYVANHHHHVFLWPPHGLPLNPAAIPTHALSDHNVDSGRQRHVSSHVTEHRPVHVILSKKYADTCKQVPKVTVSSLVAGTNSSVYFVMGKPVFLHQFIHYHLIHCQSMWPPRSTDRDDHGDLAPAPRLFFTEVSVLTQTKTTTTRHHQLGPINEFKHHHTHLHTCTVKIDAYALLPDDRQSRLL